jgi:hypothetical protein
MPMTFEKPEAIVVIDECGNPTPGLVEILEAMDIEDLLLQGSVKALDDTIALRAANKGW